MQISQLTVLLGGRGRIGLHIFILLDEDVSILNPL